MRLFERFDHHLIAQRTGAGFARREMFAKRVALRGGQLAAEEAMQHVARGMAHGASSSPSAATSSTRSLERARLSLVPTVLRGIFSAAEISS